MDLRNVIKARYNKLTASEKKIADYILNNSKEVLSLNANEIGQNAEASGATVIRFCKKIDVDGLEDLKVNIAQSSLISKNVEDVDQILERYDTEKEAVKKIYNHINNSLKSTVCLIDYNQLAEITKLMKKSENIYLYGIGASALSAYDLYHKLNRVNKKTFFNFDAHMSIEFSVYTKPEDLVIAISYGGDSKEVLLAVEKAKKNGTKIVAIVKDEKTKLSKLADYCLLVPNNEKRVRMGSVASKFSQMMLVDILYFEYIKEDMDEIIEDIKLTSEAVTGLKE